MTVILMDDKQYARIEIGGFSVNCDMDLTPKMGAERCDSAGDARALLRRRSGSGMSTVKSSLFLSSMIVIIEFDEGLGVVWGGFVDAEREFVLQKVARQETKLGGKMTRTVRLCCSVSGKVV